MLRQERPGEATGWCGVPGLGPGGRRALGGRASGGLGRWTGENPDAGRLGGTGVRVLRGRYLMEATAFAAFSARSLERAADLASFAAASCASFETT